MRPHPPARLSRFSSSTATNSSPVTAGISQKSTCRAWPTRAIYLVVLYDPRAVFRSCTLGRHYDNMYMYTTELCLYILLYLYTLLDFCPQPLPISQSRNLFRYLGSHKLTNGTKRCSFNFFIVVKFSIINIPLSREAVMYLHVVFRVVSMLAWMNLYARFILVTDTNV